MKQDQVSNIHCRTHAGIKTCVPKCIKACMPSLCAYVCVCACLGGMHVCMFCSCPLESEARVCPVTTNTASRCAQHVPAPCRETLENAKHGQPSPCWFTGSNLQRAGVVHPLGRGHAHIHALDGWTYSQEVLNPLFNHEFLFLVSDLKGYWTRYCLRCVLPWANLTF